MDRFCIVVSTAAESGRRPSSGATAAHGDLTLAPKPNGARLFVATSGCHNGEVEWKEVKGGTEASAVMRVADVVLDNGTTATVAVDPDQCSLADLVHSLCDRLPRCGYYVDLYWIVPEAADSGCLPLALAAAMMRLIEWHRGRVTVLPVRGGCAASPAAAALPPLPVEIGGGGGGSGQCRLATVGCRGGGNVGRGTEAQRDTYWRGNLVVDSAVLPGCCLRCLQDGCDQSAFSSLSCFGDQDSTAPRTSVPANNLLLITDVHLDCVPADLPCHRRFAFELPQRADASLDQLRLLFEKLTESKRALLLKLDWLQPEIGRPGCRDAEPSEVAEAALDEAAHLSCHCGKLTTQDWVSHVTQGRWQPHQQPTQAFETCCCEQVASTFFLLTTDCIDGARTLVATCVRHRHSARSSAPDLHRSQSRLPGAVAMAVPVPAGRSQSGHAPADFGRGEQQACNGKEAGRGRGATAWSRDAPTAGRLLTAATSLFDQLLPHDPAAQLCDSVQRRLVAPDRPSFLASGAGRPSDALMPSAGSELEVECDVSDWPEHRALKYRRLGASSCRGDVKGSRSPSSSVDDARHQSEGLCLTIHEMARRLSAALAADTTQSDALLQAAATGASSGLLPPPDATLPYPASNVAYAHGVHYNTDSSTEKHEARLLRNCSSLVRHEISSTCGSSAAQGSFPISVSQAASGVVALRPSRATASAPQSKPSPASKRRASGHEAGAEQRLRPKRTKASADASRRAAEEARRPGSRHCSTPAAARATAAQPTAVAATSDPAHRLRWRTDGTDPATALSAQPMLLPRSLANKSEVAGAAAAGHMPPCATRSRGSESTILAARVSADERSAASAAPGSEAGAAAAKQEAGTDLRPAKQVAADKSTSKESRSERHKRRLLDIVTKVLGQKGLTPESSSAFGACQQRLFSTVKGFVKDLPNSHSLGENMHRLAMRFCDEVIEFETRMLKAKHSSSKTRTVPLS